MLPQPLTASLPHPPSPSPAQRDRAKLLLDRALGASKVATDPDVCESYATDESDLPGLTPDAVVRAQSIEDVVETLRVAKSVGVPVTPRAAGTGRSGGATVVQGGVVLSMTGMNQIVDFDRRDGVLVVGPGTVLADVHATVEAEGWFYPPDPNSRSTCTIGGNVAENAAGPRALKYGPTRDYVLGMQAVLMGGESLEVGRRTKKGVTGYDVAALLVGSEGTLGVSGNVTLRLVPKPEHVMTLMAEFSQLADAAGAVATMIAGGNSPRCAELLDGRTLGVMRAAGHPFSQQAGALLILETDGTESGAEQEASRLADHCEAAHAISVLVAQSNSQRDRIWETRSEMSRAVRALAKHKLSEDVVVPRRNLVALLDAVNEIGDRERVTTLTYGHAGDGNMHVNFLWDDDEEKTRVDRATLGLFERTLELGGTLSGEHGIGVAKAPYLHLEQSSELIELQMRLKRAFDPEGLLNPGKIFPRVGHGAC